MPSERLVLRPPERGHKILISEAGLRVPDDPIVPLIEGDGIGPEVVREGLALGVHSRPDVHMSSPGPPLRRV